MPRQPAQRASTQAWLANTWPSSHPGLGPGVPDPLGRALAVLGCQTLRLCCPGFLIFRLLGTLRLSDGITSVDCLGYSGQVGPAHT